MPYTGLKQHTSNVKSNHVDVWGARAPFPKHLSKKPTHRSTFLPMPFSHGVTDINGDVLANINEIIIDFDIRTNI